MKKDVKIVLVILSAIILLYLVRLTTPTQIDDIHPNISCPELEIYKPEILYVIPNFNNTPISQNQKWCNEILELNKTLEIHGINHQPYREFLNEKISQENLNFAIAEFQNCFNQTPEKFKPPQLKISNDNKELIKNNNLKLETTFNQLTHKVYHCNDSGRIKNSWVRVF